ncbi:MAG: hypothetical protein KDK97_00915 [Verrucomicrobiales bacterium]|nr:hypothetical protein [Verrucomicrobiales bacterium]MCP5557569.1 hypothetical protein [Verrucomicrobiaceae bacterium]
MTRFSLAAILRHGLCGVPILVLSAMLSGCVLPPGVRQLSTVQQLTNIANALTPDTTTVRRAEAPSGTALFTDSRALNLPGRAGSIDDAARLLAGLPGSGSRNAFDDVRQSAAWMSHKTKLDGYWRDYQWRHEEPVRRWAAAKIPDIASSRAVFYPFSGPDVLFANAFFPQADTYILCGLEPAEPLPDISSLGGTDLANGFDSLGTALSNIMQFSFFITKDMRTDLQSSRFRGVLPALLVFLSRSGHTVDSVDLIRLNGDGTPVIVQGADGNGSGLMIRARSPYGTLRRIFYIRQDLSDESLSASSPILNFVSQSGNPPAFLKSASYLMHEDYFSVIRNYLLTHSPAIVQDPSGVPYRDFLKAGWRLQLFGNYQRTLDLFGEKCQQPDLAQAYRSGAHNAQPIDFGIGYLYTPATTCLMVGRR